MNKQYDFLKYNIFFEYLDEDINLSLLPCIIGYEKCSSNKDVIGPLIKTHYIINYVISGMGYLTIGDKEFVIKEKTVFLMPPNVRLVYRPDKLDPWTYIWVEFNGTSCKQLCDKAQLTAASPILLPENAENIYEEFANIIDQSIKKGSCYTLFCASKLLNIFGLLIQEVSRPKSCAMTKNEYKILPVVEYIKSHYFEADISLKGIAERMFFNASYLSRTFKEVMGVSPTRYIIELRIRKACEMLKNKAFSVTNIAETLGYSSPFYFSLEFKRITGIAPSKYGEQSLK